MVNVPINRPRIFLSHSSKDLEFVARLAQDLCHTLEDDQAVWYDAIGLKGGDLWWNRIVEEIQRCTIFIVVLSPSAVSSPWVKDEIALAWRLKNSAQNMRIIPLLYQACDIPYELENFHIIRFLAPHSYKEAFIKLTEAISPETRPMLHKHHEALEADGTSVAMVSLDQPASPGRTRAVRKKWLTRRSFTSPLPIAAYCLFAALVSFVLIRPAWCPNLFCPAPPATVVTHPDEVDDGNIRLHLLAIQSDGYVIHGDVSKTMPGKLATDVNAERIDSKSTYHLILGVQNLLQGQYSVVIERVELIVTQVLAVPQPLNVWINPPTLTYRGNPYQAVYREQGVGTPVVAVYTPAPIAPVQLAPGEPDELDIQLVSQDEVDLKFQVQITYRIANTSTWHEIMLPQVCEVILSSTANWHPYELKRGRLTPLSAPAK